MRRRVQRCCWWPPDPVAVAVLCAVALLALLGLSLAPSDGGVARARSHVEQAVVGAPASMRTRHIAPPPPGAKGPALASFANRHVGRRAFLLGNGPSLNLVDLHLLHDEIVFATNNIYLKAADMAGPPTYYVVEDTYLAEDRNATINAYHGPTKFFGTHLTYVLEDGPDVVWLPVDFYYPVPLPIAWPDFGRSAGVEMNVGGTVSYQCLQLAYYMGITELYLVGFDHSYTIQSDVKKDGNKLVSTKDNDVSHFSKDYFGQGLRWHDPRVDRMEMAYAQAHKAFREVGREVYNAGVGGKLEVFPRRDYELVTAPFVPTLDLTIILCVAAPRIDGVRRLLAALTAQTDVRTYYELIFVDNDVSSPLDESAVTSLWRDVGGRVPLRLVREAAPGLSRARNTGIRAARGKLIAFLDADDAIPAPTWMSSVLASFDDPTVAVAGGPVRVQLPHPRATLVQVTPVFDGPLPSWIGEGERQWSFSRVDYGEVRRYLSRPERLTGANIAFERAVFSAVGMFDVTLGRTGALLIGHEETQLQWRIAASGRRVLYHPDAAVEHHVTASRLTRSYLDTRIVYNTLTLKMIAMAEAGRQQEHALLVRLLWWWRDAPPPGATRVVAPPQVVALLVRVAEMLEALPADTCNALSALGDALAYVVQPKTYWREMERSVRPEGVCGRC